MYRYQYLDNLKLRRKHKQLKANVALAQVLGWVLSLLGAFHYFILLEPEWLYPLIFGNGLIFLGLAAPDAVQSARVKLEFLASTISTLLLRLLLSIVYFLVLCPMGILLQSIKGRAPFYSWEPGAPLADSQIEGWTLKKCSDQAHLIGNRNVFFSNHIVQLFAHLFSNADLLILPSLLVIISLGLLAIFIQSTPLAPMIYTLF